MLSLLRIRCVVAVSVALLCARLGRAQTYAVGQTYLQLAGEYSEVVSLNDMANFVQSSNTSAVLTGAQIEASVNSFTTNLAGLNPTFTAPNSSSPVSGFSFKNGQWSYAGSNYVPAGGLPANQVALNSIAGSGSYGFTVGGVSLPNVSLPTSVTTPSVPVMAASSGVYSGSGSNWTLTVNAAQSITFSGASMPFGAGYTSGQSGIIMMFMDETTGTTLIEQDTLSSFSGTSESFTLAANYLTPGHTYDLQTEYLTSVNASGPVNPDTTTISGGLVVSGFGRTTDLTIVASAIPEPSSSALALGLAALAGVMALRRRKALATAA